MRRAALGWFCVVAIGCGDGGGVAPDAGGADAGSFDASSPGSDASAAADAGLGAPCSTDSDCDDGVACTADRCTPGTGTCRHLAPDADGDGHGVASCASASGTPLGDDCDDADVNAYPGNIEVCDATAHDEDCEPTTYGIRDADGDSFVDVRCCNGTTCGPDCDDMRDIVHPGAPEACDASDNDCNGLVDDATLRTWYRDSDHDGFGVTAMTVTAGCAPVDYASVGGDCADDNASRNPGTAEVCNGIDDNCVGGIDEGVLVRYYADCDGDGWGGGAATPGCAPPIAPPTSCPTRPWLTASGDCDDVDWGVHPGTTETCNGRDDECDGTIDGVPAEAWCNAPAQLAGLRATAATCGAAGACASTACASPYLDCTSGPGCETDPRTSRSSCGMCGHACAWICAASSCDDADDISAGNGHSCARRASGAVDCWGENLRGQLGDGTTTNRSTPVAVSGVADAVGISAGNEHSCARRASGAVDCWGRNEYGQLGDGTTSERHTPVSVGGLADAVEISARSGVHACARRASGAVDCWGLNNHGQLGDGTTTERHTPVSVGGLADAVEISAGLWHTCARRISGAVVCWGSNTWGQLGDGGTTDQWAPVSVPGLTDAVEISAAGYHSCARRASGTVVCWGRNEYGQLGDGTMFHSTCSTFDCSLIPVAVSGLSDAVEISAWNNFTCARRTSGEVVCWGYNGWGALGDGTTTNRWAPVAVVGLADAVAISAGAAHTCARRASGRLACWGRNQYGGLGDGTTTMRLTPVAVVPSP